MTKRSHLITFIEIEFSNSLHWKDRQNCITGKIAFSINNSTFLKVTQGHFELNKLKYAGLHFSSVVVLIESLPVPCNRSAQELFGNSKWRHQFRADISDFCTKSIEFWFDLNRKWTEKWPEVLYLPIWHYQGL